MTTALVLLGLTLLVMCLGLLGLAAALDVWERWRGDR